MSMIIKNSLDPIYETVFLLYIGYDMEKYREQAISQLKESGHKGEEYYQKHYQVIDQYISAFQKFRIAGDNDSFYFQDTTMEFYISLVTPLFCDKNLVNEMDHFDNERLFQIILNNSVELFEMDSKEYDGISHEEFKTTDKIMSFVKQVDLSEQEKWKTLMILQNPKEHYGYLSDLIQKNIPAFEKAMESKKAFVSKNLKQFERTYKTEEDVMKFLKEFHLADFRISEMIPTLATATSILLMANNFYYGMLAEETMSDLGISNEGTKYLQNCLKALSDHSKLEILSTLKNNPKYASELAAQLQLTPATVSHHMNTLLSLKLIYIEKSGGKYYYHVNTDAIKEVMEQLQKLLILYNNTIG